MSATSTPKASTATQGDRQPRVAPTVRRNIEAADDARALVANLLGRALVAEDGEAEDTLRAASKLLPGGSEGRKHIEGFLEAGAEYIGTLTASELSTWFPVSDSSALGDAASVAEDRRIVAALATAANREAYRRTARKYQALAERGLTPGEIAAEMESHFKQEAETFGHAEPPQTLDVLDGGDTLAEALRLAETRQPLVRAGWPRTEELLGGWAPRNLTILAGAPGSGKSTLGRNLINGFLRANPEGRALSVHTEQHPHAMDVVTLGSLSGVDMRRIRRGELGPEARQRVRDAANEALAWAGRLGTLFAPLAQPERLGGAAARWFGDSHPRLLVLDSLQAWRTGGRFADRRNEIDFLTTRLSDWKVELEAHVLAISHLARRQGGYDRPALDDLKESGGLEYLADAVLALATPRGAEGPAAAEGRVPLELTVLKSRGGPTGKVSVTAARTCGHMAEEVLP